MTLIDDLRAELGDAGVLTDPAATASSLTDWRGAWSGTALAVMRRPCSSTSIWPMPARAAGMVT